MTIWIKDIQELYIAIQGHSSYLKKFAHIPVSACMVMEVADEILESKTIF